MSTWAEFAAAAPRLAAAVEERFAASRYALVATLRGDGFPRISGIVARVDGGELWITTKARSAIANDLRREPRCSLHSGPMHGGEPRGDAKLQGRAAEEPAGAGMTRFRIDLADASTSASATRPSTTCWSRGGPARKGRESSTADRGGRISWRP